MNQTPPTNHLDPDQLNAFIDGELTPAEHQGIEQHLAICHACTLRVLSATRLKAATARAGQRFAPLPDAIARLTAQLHAQQTQTKPQLQAETKRTARIYSMPSLRPAAWAAIAAAILLTVSLLGWRQLHQTNTLAAELLDQHLATLSSGATPQVISTDRHTVPPSKAQISPTSTANPLLCSSSPSTNTKSPSSLRNAPPAPRSPHCP